MKKIFFMTLFSVISISTFSITSKTVSQGITIPQGSMVVIATMPINASGNEITNEKLSKMIIGDNSNNGYIARQLLGLQDKDRALMSKMGWENVYYIYVEYGALGYDSSSKQYSYAMEISAYKIVDYIENKENAEVVYNCGTVIYSKSNSPLIDMLPNLVLASNLYLQPARIVKTIEWSDIDWLTATQLVNEIKSYAK